MGQHELFALTTAPAGGSLPLLQHVLELLYTFHGNIVLFLQHSVLKKVS
jgi:hypothetical protein